MGMFCHFGLRTGPSLRVSMGGPDVSDADALVRRQGLSDRQQDMLGIAQPCIRERSAHIRDQRCYVLSLGGRFSGEPRRNKFVANPLSGELNGFPIFRPVPIVFREEDGGVSGR